MLSNAYFLAKFRFDTAENEPAKNKKFANFPNFANPNIGAGPDRCVRLPLRGGRPAPSGAEEEPQPLLRRLRGDRPA